MRQSQLVLVSVVVCAASLASADVFGSGENQFTIDFIRISGSTNPTIGIPAGHDFTFTGVNYHYRMGTYEITYDQWEKFKINMGGPVAGTPSTAYDTSHYFTGMNEPANKVSWYEAVQFVNWLNTSTGHQAAYKFTGTKGTADYTLDTWSTAEATGGTNLYRHKDAFYFLPKEDEWVKAAYWNGTNLQRFSNASAEDLVPVFVHPVFPDPLKWNYFPSAGNELWAVGSGIQELNGTHDMMGNVWEWMENPESDINYGTASDRVIRGGSYDSAASFISSNDRFDFDPSNELDDVGFRIASRFAQIIMNVSIDIRPGSEVDPVNPKSHGVLPVAINGSETLDVSQIDLASLLLQGASPRARGNSGKIGTFEDINGDSFLDLVLHFDIEGMDITAGLDSLNITGWLLDGTGIEGSDSIRIVPGDANLDGVVDVSDLAIMGANYGQHIKGRNKGDFNGDGIIDVGDLAVLGTGYGTISGMGDFSSNMAIPEPATMAVLTFGGLAMIRRRRK